MWDFPLALSERVTNFVKANGQTLLDIALLSVLLIIAGICLSHLL